MGIDLVKQAAVRCGHLNGNAYKVLICMCVHALDKPNGKGQPPNLYFGGWEPLALALGYELPSGDDDASKKRRHNLSVIVWRAVADLKRGGLVKPLVDHPRTRQRQCFELTLSTAETADLSTAETAVLEHCCNNNLSTAETAVPNRYIEDQAQDLPEDIPASVDYLVGEHAREAEEETQL